MRLRGASIGLVAVMLVSGTLAAVPARAEAGPVLWNGEVRNAGGAPEAAEVIAYLRPVADELQPGVLLTPIARTTTDAAGRFRLRALPTDRILAVADPWVTVMVVAYAADGMSLAVDSVAWRAGRWITRPGELEPGGVELPGFPAEERPPVLVIRPPATGAAIPAATPPPVGLCAMTKKRDLDPGYVTVGELHLNTGWAGEFTYTNTKSTSFEVGWRPAGKNWSGGGSSSGSHDTGISRGGEIPAEDGPRMFHYDLQTLFRLYTWRCRGHDAEHTDSWGDVETVEASGWTGGVRRYGGGPEPGCNGQYESPVPPGEYLSRSKGASTTFGGAINVLGFSGSVTSAVSSSVNWKWTNTMRIERNLCGETNWVRDKNTRVRSME
jgi:hypothetical protein